MIDVPSRGDGPLRARWHDAGRGAPCVVILNGFPGRALNDDLCDALARSGASVLQGSWRGRGPSGGTFSYSRGFQEAVETMHHARVLGEPRRLTVVGHSYGAFAALVAAPHVRPDHLTLLAPLTDPARLLADLGDDALRWSWHVAQWVIDGDPATWEREFRELARTDVAALARQVAGIPFVAAHGARDAVVNPEATRAFLEHHRAAGGKSELWAPDADHYFSGPERGELLRQVIAAAHGA